MTPCPTPPPMTKPFPGHRPRPPRPAKVKRKLSVCALLVAANLAPTGAAIAQAPQIDGVDTALQYCTNLTDAAADARFARKAARLEALEMAVEERLVALEQKRAEYQDWLQRREAFLERAQDGLVSIYRTMAPDAASEQLAAMDEITAAAIVAKLPSRAASAVMNEMATDKAARIATIMSGMGRENDRVNQG
ncbi:MAG: MotE family protein [Pseudomonadota bacterium]